MKLFTAVLMVVLFCLPVQSKSVELGEIVNPGTLTVGEKHLYITESIHVFIYTVDGTRLVKKLGKAGEGPWEFRKSPAPWIPSLNVYLASETLVVNSIGKVSFFTREGEPIREEKVAVGNGLAPVVPVGKRWVRTAFARPQGESAVFFVSNLLDEKMKKVKELGRFPHLSVPGKTNPIVNARIFELMRRFSDGDFFFLPDPRSGQFQVFTSSGERKAVIQPEYNEVPLSSNDKKRWETYFLNDVRFKRIYESDRANIHYPDNLPVVRDHRPADGRLYIIAGERSSKGFRTFVYDYSGGFLGELTMPVKDKDILESYPFSIRNHTLYQLVEDEEEEAWILETTPLAKLEK